MRVIVKRVLLPVIVKRVLLPCKDYSEDFQVIFRPQKGLRSHLRASNFQKLFLGEHASRPPSLILCIQVQVLVQHSDQCNFASARPVFL